MSCNSVYPLGQSPLCLETSSLMTQEVQLLQDISRCADMLLCNWSVLNASSEMREVPGVLKQSWKFPSSIRCNGSVLLSKSCLCISISETFNSRSFIPLAIWEVWTVHSYYMAQITTMLKNVFWKYWSNVKFWHNYVIFFHYKSKLILSWEGNTVFVVLVYISVCGKYNM